MNFFSFLVAWCILATGLRAGEGEDYFGAVENRGEALIGILYDLKQNQKREKTTETETSYLKVLAQFLDQDWNESVLNRFYRVTRPLYAARICIPLMKAEAAPAAFGASDSVKPRMWLVHYKGQVSPPEDGAYRFVGVADNVLAVAVNSKTVLVSYIRGSKVPCAWDKKNGNGKSNAFLPVKNEAFNGDWMELKKDQPIDLDIVTGERPGGAFWAWLLIEKKGESYARNDQGKRLLPVFQLGGGKGPSGFPEGKPWRAYQ